MGYWLASALLLALASLATARYITSPRWVDALLATGSFLGLASAMLVGLVLRRLARSAWLARPARTPGEAPRRARRWKPVAALVLASSAALARAALLDQLAADTLAARTIHFGRITLACSTVVWGGVALLWGTLAVTDALEGSRGTRWAEVVVGGAGVTLALHSLAPLWLLLGLKINHWTLFGLFGLACLAYLAGRLYEWLARRREV